MPITGTLEEHLDDAIARIADEFTLWGVYRQDQLFQSVKWFQQKQECFIGFEIASPPNINPTTGQAWRELAMTAYLRIPMSHPDPYTTCSLNALALSEYIDKRAFKHSSPARPGEVRFIGLDSADSDERSQAGDPDDRTAVMFQVDWETTLLVDVTINPYPREFGGYPKVPLDQITYGNEVNGTDRPDEVVVTH